MYGGGAVCGGCVWKVYIRVGECGLVCVEDGVWCML